MAKKVVATIKTKESKNFAKVVAAVRSPKTNAYTFREKIVKLENVDDYIKDLGR